MTTVTAVYLQPKDTATASPVAVESLGDIAIDMDNPGHARVAIYMSTAQATALRDSLTAAMEGQS